MQRVRLSNCSLSALLLGQRRRPQTVGPQCCWTCIDCGGNTVANTTKGQSCFKCPANFKANPEHTQCVVIDDLYMKWDDMVVSVILSLSSIGLGMVFLTAIAFLKYRDTPVVKAASRGLCYVLLFGVSLFYLLPFTMIGKPTELTCSSIPFVLGLGLSVNVGMCQISYLQLCISNTSSIERSS